MAKLTLLVADDDEMNRFVIKKFLKDDYDILEAVDGQAAKEVLESRQVDLVLLDIIMPKMDGLEVLEWLRSKKECQRVGVLVASSTKEKTEREALGRGADDIVGKPYDPVVIKTRLQNVQAKKKLEQMVLGDKQLQQVASNQEVTKLVEEKVQLIEDISKLLIKNIGNKKLVEEFAHQIHDTAESLVGEIQGGEDENS